MIKHAFVRIAEDSLICAVCGCHEHEHQWGCKKHNTAGNGEFNCHMCRESDKI